MEGFLFDDDLMEGFSFDDDLMEGFSFDDDLMMMIIWKIIFLSFWAKSATVVGDRAEEDKIR